MIYFHQGSTKSQICHENSAEVVKPNITNLREERLFPVPGMRLNSAESSPPSILPPLCVSCCRISQKHSAMYFCHNNGYPRFLEGVGSRKI